MLNKTRKISIISAAIFVAAEALLGILIQCVSGYANNLLSFSSILLAFLFVLLCLRSERIYFLSLLAMGTTLCADFLLVILDPPLRVLAMLFFSVTQISYFLIIYLKTENKRTKILHIATRVAFLAISLILVLLVLGDGADALSIISMLYFANLLLNILFSFLMKERSLIFSLGLISFSLCDVFVGMGMIGNYILVGDSALLSFLTNPPFNAVWLFYVPAQTLLALFAKGKQNNEPK